MSAHRTHRLDQARRVKAAIQQHQHPTLHRAQQGIGALLLIGPMRAQEGIDDQMGSALEQINATHLRIGGRTHVGC